MRSIKIQTGFSLGDLLLTFAAMVLLLFSCRQAAPSQQKINTDSTQPVAILLPDSNQVAILSAAHIDFFSLKDSLPATLVTRDLPLIEKLLANGVKVHNTGQDSTRLYTAYIDLAKYKRQYIPYTNAKGDKMVFINCFCKGIENKNWKTALLMVDDGGKCFFNITVNLSQKTCGRVLMSSSQ